MEKRLYLICSIAFIGLVSLILGIFVNINSNSITPISVLVGNSLSVDYEESRDLTLSKAKPLTDDDALNEKALVFSVTNLRSENSIYSLKLEEDTTIKNRLSREFVKITIIKNDELIVNSEYLNSFGKDLSILQNQKIEPNSIDNYRVYIYLDSEASMESGKNYKAKLFAEKLDLTEEEAKDTESPVITLNGESVITINQNDEYNDLGIKSIIDNVDGEISLDDVSIKYMYFDGVKRVAVSKIDTSKIGNYYIYYMVHDKASNETISIRVINVRALENDSVDNTNQDNEQINPDNQVQPDNNGNSVNNNPALDESFKVSINYSTKEKTNKDVLVTITSDEAMLPISGYQLSNDKKTLTRSFSTNTESTIVVFSQTMKTAIINISISNIDKTEATKPQDDPLPTPTPGKVSLKLDYDIYTNALNLKLTVAYPAEVVSYSYMCGDGNWSDATTEKQYRCSNLIMGTTYKVAARAVTKNSGTITTAISSVKTSAFDPPSYSASTDLATSREITINYNGTSDYLNYYKIDDGEWVVIYDPIAKVILEKDATITAMIREKNNNNNLITSTYKETKIDSSAPSISNGVINISNVTTNGASISYSGATDDKSSVLTYDICLSTNSNLNIDNCLNSKVTSISNGYNYTFSNLNESTTYYTNVVVSDSFNRHSIYNVAQFTTGKTVKVWGEHFEIANRNDLVGINFSTWFDYMHNKSSGIYNISNGSFGNIGDFHYWGEPAKGYYKSTDKNVIRQQMTELVNMGVDFIIIDNTNAVSAWFAPEALSPASVFYQAVYAPMKALLDTMVEMRNEGLPTPYVVNWVRTNEEYLVMNVMDNLFVSTTYDTSLHNEKYSNLWVYLDNKPFYLITSTALGALDRDVSYRVMWGLQPAVKKGEWSYLQKNNANNLGTNINGTIEQISVSVAMQQTRMSNTSTATGRNHGITLYNQWSNAFKIRPKIVTLTWWNEWGAERLDPFEPTCTTYCFTDNYNEEYSRDIEPQKGGLGDTYYQRTKQYITAYKNHASVPRLVDAGY